MGYTPSKNIKEQPVMFNKTLSFDKVEEIFRGAFDIKDQLIFFEPMSASDSPSSAFACTSLANLSSGDITLGDIQRLTVMCGQLRSYKEYI